MSLQYGHDVIFDSDCGPFEVKGIFCVVFCDGIVTRKFETYRIGDRARILYPDGPVDVKHVNWYRIGTAVYEKKEDFDRNPDPNYWKNMLRVLKFRSLMGHPGSSEVICSPWMDGGESFRVEKGTP